MDISDLRLLQNHYFRFPLFIPSSTQDAISIVPLSWAAVSLRMLITKTQKGIAQPASLLLDSSSVRPKLRLKRNTSLIAVLNGLDWQLEKFWGMDRPSLFAALKQSGFLAVTGPTFSIVHEYPASHNVFMQRRHHKVIQQIQEAGLLAIPNIYLRNDFDAAKWTDWLISQEDLFFVSRDFSRTKRAEFSKELEVFVSLLSKAKRQLHILLVGVGLVNGLQALRQLDRIGCTGSIISPFPVRVAITEGRRLKVGDSGKVIRDQDRSTSRHDLVLSNIAVMENYLLEKVSTLPSYAQTQLVANLAA